MKKVILVLVFGSFAMGLRAQCDSLKDVTITIEGTPVLYDYNGLHYNPLTQPFNTNLFDIMQNPNNARFMKHFQAFSVDIRAMSNWANNEYDILFIPNPYPIEQYILNPEDPDDENIDRQLYNIALRAKHLFKDTHLNQFIIDSANKVVNDCIDLRTFREWTPIVNGEYPENILNELQAVLDSTDLVYIAKNPEVYGQIEHYIPALFVANIERADPSKMPIFSAGISVNSELPGMEKYDDYLVVWYFDGTNFVEGLISEIMALSTKHPIIIVDNACGTLTETPKNTQKGGNNEPACSDNNVTDEMRRSSYKIYGHQIKERYRCCTKTQFCLVSTLIDEYGNELRHGSRVSLPCANNPNGCIWFDHWNMIDEIPKKNLNKNLYVERVFCGDYFTSYPLKGGPSVGYSEFNNVVPFECNYYFWNTFDRKYNKSVKFLGKGEKNGTTIYLYGNMEYNSNWFSYNPNDVENNPFDFAFTFSKCSKTRENSISEVTIYRDGSCIPIKKGR